MALSLENSEHFLAIMQRYEAPLFRYIKRLIATGDQDAEDILQEAFIKCYQNLNAYNPELKFSSWLYRITHNEAISHYRKNSKKSQEISIEEKENLIKTLADKLDIKTETHKKLLSKNIKELLNQLDHKYREVLILKFLEDKDYQEISDILKKPSGTIATLINRAKTKFKELLKRHNITPENA